MIPSCDPNRFTCVPVVFASNVGSIVLVTQHITGTNSVVDWSSIVEVPADRSITRYLPAGTTVITATTTVPHGELVAYNDHLTLPSLPSGFNVQGGGPAHALIGRAEELNLVLVPGGSPNEAVFIGYDRLMAGRFPATVINLVSGWNLVAFPKGIERHTAETLLAAINAQGGNATEIHRWQAGGWEGHIFGLPFNNFTMQIGRGYFVKTNGPSTFKP